MAACLQGPHQARLNRVVSSTGPGLGSLSRFCPLYLLCVPKPKIPPVTRFSKPQWLPVSYLSLSFSSLGDK